MRRQEVRQLWLVGLALIGGCRSEEKVISPVDPVITQGALDDFGLEGTWIEMTDPRYALSEEGPQRPVEIIRGGDTYLVKFKSDDAQDLDIEPCFKVVTIHEDWQHLIVQFEMMWSGKPSRYMLLALRRGDKLHVWKLNSSNLVKCLREDNHTAVLGHFGFSTAVHADANELLKTIRFHAQELVGTPMTFVRVKETPAP